jgi:DNA-binding IclR family transcriptional regulator
MRVGRTIVDADAMRREVELIRRRGYAIDKGEFDAAARAVAAPVFDHMGLIFQQIVGVTGSIALRNG